jgi:acyl-ACP thioesterase
MTTFRDAAMGFDMVANAGKGRQFFATRRVRLGDATPQGRLRLDAIARYLQDVANDDSRSADWSDPHWWVVRRTVVDIIRFPKYLEEILLTTWCGGLGSHWAERRTTISTLDGETLVEAAALWVHVDEATLQPSRVPQDIADDLAVSSAGRKIGARLLLKPQSFATGADVSAWPLRFSDFDAVGHMNNAAYWEVLEESMTTRRDLRDGMRAVMEHVVQVEPGQELQREIHDTADGVSVQLAVNNNIHAAAWMGVIA